MYDGYNPFGLSLIKVIGKVVKTVVHNLTLRTEFFFLPLELFTVNRYCLILGPEE